MDKNISKEEWKNFAELLYRMTDSKRDSIGIVLWAEKKMSRFEKMKKYIDENPQATLADLNYQMALIHIEEQNKQKIERDERNNNG